MTENTQNQDNQADLNKSQQPESGAAKTDQTLNQGQTGQEPKTFKTDQTELEAKQANPDIEDDAEIDDQGEDTQSETSNS